MMRKYKLTCTASTSARESNSVFEGYCAQNPNPNVYPGQNFYIYAQRTGAGAVDGNGPWKCTAYVASAEKLSNDEYYFSTNDSDYHLVAIPG